MIQAPLIDQNAAEMYQYLFNVAKELAGCTDEVLNSRKYPTICYRFATYKILQDEGFSLSQIGRAAKKSHTAIHHDISLLNYALEHKTDKNCIACYSLLKAHTGDLNKQALILTNRKMITKWLQDNGARPELVGVLLDNLRQITI